MAVRETAEERIEALASPPPSARRARSKTWPLSPAVYLVRNAGRTIPLTGVIMLAVLLVSGVIALIDSIPESIRSTYSYSRLMLGVSPRGDTLETPKLITDIVHHSPVAIDRAMVCRVSGSEVDSIVGKWPFVMLGLGQEDMRYYLQRMGVSHIEGRLPKPGAPEAIVSTPVAKNLHLVVYDPSAPYKVRSRSVILAPDKQDSYSPNYVHVVGIADTPEWVMLNSIEYQRAYNFPPVDLGLVFARNAHDQSILDHWAIKRFRGKHAQLYAYSQIEENTKTMFHTLYTILDVVIATLALVITFMMGMLMNIYQSQRLVEFGLLQAIGYTRWQLLRRVFYESAIVVVVGWILGVIASMGLLYVANKTLMAPHAFSIEAFDPTAFKYTEPLPFAILLVAGFTVWWRFRRFDPVSIVERRLA